MALFDNLDDKMKDMMDDPEKREHLEQMAKERGIGLEEAAREHFSQSSDDNQQ